MRHHEYKKVVHWRNTANAVFPYAALVDGDWWVLRINRWPDHPFWTFFASGSRRFDIDDLPNKWHMSEAHDTALGEREVTEALAGIAEFHAYGSEVGQPCDNLFCCG